MAMTAWETNLSKKGIKTIHAMRESGASFQAIADFVNSQGVPCTYEGVRLYFRFRKSANDPAPEQDPDLIALAELAKDMGFAVKVNPFSITVSRRTRKGVLPPG